MALPLVASASTSRVEGMAVQGDYIKDETGIFTYPNEVANVGNFVYGELGDWNGTNSTPYDRAMGAVLGNLWEGRYGAWGIHMREFTPQLGQGDITSNPSPGTMLGSDPNFNQWESFDLQWGKKFGNKTLGLRMNRSYGKLEADNGEFGALSIFKGDYYNSFYNEEGNLYRNIFGLGGGLGWEMGPNTTAEVSVLWQSRTYQVRDSTGVDQFKDDGPTTWQFA
ncbi:MAG TPA: hypothetical protein VMU34_09210, partial [Mycobacterium sp.]|nr:hypothetical protein [Mycobacterium sp.]